MIGRACCWREGETCERCSRIPDEADAAGFAALGVARAAVRRLDATTAAFTAIEDACEHVPLLGGDAALRAWRDAWLDAGITAARVDARREVARSRVEALPSADPHAREIADEFTAVSSSLDDWWNAVLDDLRTAGSLIAASGRGPSSPPAGIATKPAAPSRPRRETDSQPPKSTAPPLRPGEVSTPRSPATSLSAVQRPQRSEPRPAPRPPESDDRVHPVEGDGERTPSPPGRAPVLSPAERSVRLERRVPAREPTPIASKPPVPPVERARPVGPGPAAEPAAPARTASPVQSEGSPAESAQAVERAATSTTRARSHRLRAVAVGAGTLVAGVAVAGLIYLAATRFESGAENDGAVGAQASHGRSATASRDTQSPRMQQTAAAASGQEPVDVSVDLHPVGPLDPDAGALVPLTGDLEVVAFPTPFDRSLRLGGVAGVCVAFEEQPRSIGFALHLADAAADAVLAVSFPRSGEAAGAAYSLPLDDVVGSEADWYQVTVNPGPDGAEVSITADDGRRLVDGRGLPVAALPGTPDGVCLRASSESSDSAVLIDDLRVQ